MTGFHKKRNTRLKWVNDNQKELQEKDFSMVPENMTNKTTSSRLADEEIFKGVTETNNDKVEEMEDGDELIVLSSRDAKNSLEILKMLCLFCEKRAYQMQDLINKVETLITKDKI